MTGSLAPEILRSLELFKIGARRAFLGTRQGGHISPKRGHGIEFSDYRQYELGDNPRHIDWGLYGRTDRLYVKRFQEEQDLNVLLALDASASMGAVPADRKWERACEICHALGYIALMSHDSVSLAISGEFVGASRAAAFVGPRAYAQFARSLASRMPEGAGSFAREMRHVAARVRFPGVAIVISDFLMEFEEIESGLNTLRAKNLDITVMHVMGAHDREPEVAERGNIVRDSETGEEVSIALNAEVMREYQQIFSAHQVRIQDFCAAARIGYVEARAEEELGVWIQEALPAVGLLR